MTARSRMTQRTRVERLTPGAIDDSGNPSPGTWAEHIAALPCWLYGSAERESVTEEKTAVVTDLKALVPLGTDITEQDRLNQVVDRRGNVIEPGLLEIDTVLYQRSHLALTLVRVSS